MSNNYFQFKQFTIHQDKCAMKVCTDACLFGGYIADRISKKEVQPGSSLDIGSGTGLLSILLAQKCNTTIDAIEIDQDAYQQAKENFTNTPWCNRLQIHCTDALQFQAEKKYDFIFSNPPFFGNDLRSDNQQINAAKHDTTLTLDQLIQIVDINLSSEGSFAILLPYHRSEYFIGQAKKTGFHLQEKISVQQTPSHDFFRSMLFFSRSEREFISAELSIKNSNNEYTENFVELLKDYYLYL
ncbi:methyltransferase [Ferruginibacter lapsinanis]|uniref:tRNA1(Val) (adenine(37)-N6)-methyltransferase n=1 Tax=Ferruginibacter lapsinanis TaxID=563172 RepID=UPI001E61623E|nr:methyltransferase [Ferruginibacter lapsinanis]UEG49029.1 methyltransferase [Ferruginibacter lapsinanis]